MPHVFILPGWQDSGPAHWQSRWEREHSDFTRVQQRDWDHPIVEEWIATLDAALVRTDGPAVLVAHSMGCLTVAHWAACYRRPIQGALLVAPADVERPDCPPELQNFAPIPMQPLPFRSILVGSVSDPWMTETRARELAAAWGSRFVALGDAGHINVDAGYGPWPTGEALLRELL